MPASTRATLPSAAATAGRGARGEVPVVRLVVSCADRPGIVAAISSFLTEAGANIVSSDQYSTDPDGGRFFLRAERRLCSTAAR